MIIIPNFQRNFKFNYLSLIQFQHLNRFHFNFHFNPTLHIIIHLILILIKFYFYPDFMCNKFLMNHEDPFLFNISLLIYIEYIYHSIYIQKMMFLRL